jgi:Transposase
MTSETSTTARVWVAIDVAKAFHQVLIETPEGQRRAWRVANALAEVNRLVSSLRALKRPCLIAFEPTGDYHRPLVYALGQAGFELRQVSSLAVARTRDALYNSWDKNDPKDAQVILHLLKTGATQRFLDPLLTGHNDLQEMANTYQQVSLRKVRLHHAILTHHLPMYFPEAERYLHSSRADWFTELLLVTPCPAAVRRYSKAAFISAVRERVGGRKVDKARWLADFTTPPRRAWGCRWARTQKRCACFGSCSRNTSSSVAAASSSRRTSSTGSRVTPTSPVCRPSLASGRFSR